jgi:hypothetical protein
MFPWNSSYELHKNFISLDLGINIFTCLVQLTIKEVSLQIKENVRRALYKWIEFEVFVMHCLKKAIPSSL